MEVTLRTVDIDLERAMHESAAADGMLDLWGLGLQAYVTCDVSNDFVIDLDIVFKAIGFTRKDNAKRIVMKNLKEGIDFQIAGVQQEREKRWGFPHLGGKPTSPSVGGRPSETVMLTVNGFKQICMMAETAQGRKVREYYLQLEMTMYKYFMQRQERIAKDNERIAKDNEQIANDLRRELVEANAHLEKVKERSYQEVQKTDTIYICKEQSELATDVHKIGRTINPKRREAQFNTGSAQGCKMIYERLTHNAKLVEDVVKDVMHRYHIVNGAGGTEHYDCCTEHSVQVLDATCVFLDTLVSSHRTITRDDFFTKIHDNLYALEQKQTEKSKQTETTYSTVDEITPLPDVQSGTDTSNGNGNGTNLIGLCEEWFRNNIVVKEGEVIKRKDFDNTLLKVVKEKFGKIQKVGPVKEVMHRLALEATKHLKNGGYAEKWAFKGEVFNNVYGHLMWA
jgi:hypothetical protein